MAIETRARGGVYYYRARKEGGRVVKTYAGAGQAARLAEAIDARIRAIRHAEEQDERIALAVFEAEETDIEDLCKRTEILVRAALLGAGYHRHERGEWRRRRG